MQLLKPAESSIRFQKEGAKVEAEAVENGKGKKVIVFKYKAKKNYHKKQGHRQPYTMLKIESISV